MRHRTWLLASLAVAAIAIGATRSPGDVHHIKAPLEANGSTGAGGFVQIEQLPHGGSNVHVMATGLHPGTLYASFYYESANCTEPADLLGTFTAAADGTGEVSKKIDDDVDEVGSVSVRLGPGYGDLQACAKLH